MKKSIIHRAFELAQSRAHPDLKSIERTLSKEGYTNTYEELQGPELRRRLLAMCRGEQAKEADKGPRRATIPTRCYPFD